MNTYELVASFAVFSTALLAGVMLYDVVDRVRWARFDGQKNMQRRIERRRRDMGML